MIFDSWMKSIPTNLAEFIEDIQIYCHYLLTVALKVFE